MQLVSTGDVISAIDRAKTVKLDAYVLGQGGGMLRALERAADRGADVRVALADANAGSASIVRELRGHGVRVLDDPAVGAGSVHGKVAVVDYRAFYDDRNWRTSGGNDLIVETDIDDAFALRTKAQVLEDEAAFIRTSEGHEILAATESFGPGPVANALLERAQHGDDVRLLYNPNDNTRGRERVLASLRDAGVRIEESDDNHKYACAGDSAWIGSANATVTGGPTGMGLEWGTQLDGRLAAKVHAQAERQWNEPDSSVHRHPRA
jgi:hypothetical protein